MPTGVFISYAREDRAFVGKLYNDLKRAGAKPWLDYIDLIPGQRWEVEIRKAISNSRYFIAVLSSLSVGKKGFVQKEIRLALEIADEYPEDKIFIIPLRIDECEPSFEALRTLQRADLFPSYDQGLKELLRVFTYDTEERRALFKIVIGSMTGQIASLKRGFGFIRSEFSPHYLFFHTSELQGVTFDELNEDDPIQFSIAQGPKGLVATRICRAA